MKEIKDIAMWEETDSKLAKYTICNLQRENKILRKRIDKIIEYIEKFEDIKAYYSYEENGYEEYNYDEDFKKDLLDILRGEEDD